MQDLSDIFHDLPDLCLFWPDDVETHFPIKVHN